MKRISKIKKSNLDGHFVKTGKSMKHFSVFLLQHELVCLKYYFLLPPYSSKECWSSLSKIALSPCLPEFPAAAAWSEVLEVPVKGSKLDSHWMIPLLQNTYIWSFNSKVWMVLFYNYHYNISKHQEQLGWIQCTRRFFHLWFTCPLNQCN